MTRDELILLGQDCFAAFNAQAPAPSSRSWDMWAETCASVPFKAAAFIRARIINLDSRPLNFGKAVQAYGLEWRAQNSRPGAQSECCPGCDPRVPGFFYAWRRDEAGYLRSCMLRCLCNNDPKLGNIPRMSREYAAQQGLFVMPPDYPGGPARFERNLPGNAGRGLHGTGAGAASASGTGSNLAAGADGEDTRGTGISRALDAALRHPGLERPRYENTEDAYAAGY